MDWNQVYIGLKVMVEGMSGIFLALFIIYGFIIFLRKVFPIKDEE